MSCSMNANKINGYDGYDVREDARTLIKAEEIKISDTKYYNTVLAEVKKIAKAATEAAEAKSAAAKEVALHKKVGKGLKKVFGDKK